MSIQEIYASATAAKGRKRVGRGIASGKGKTCGRGVKGQKSRSGVAIKGFEGGQMPIHRRLPKRGFNNIFREDVQVINLSQLEDFIKAKKIKASDKLDQVSLYNSGLVSKKNQPVKILGRGEIKTALNLEVDAVSKSAAEAIKKAGGSVTISAKAEVREEKAKKEAPKAEAEKA